MQGFDDVNYKNENYVGQNCNPTLTDDECNASPDNLKYDVYYPTNYNNYNTCDLPAVILFHAGGFSDCSNYQQTDITIICQELAKRGFVVFNVEYRRGRIQDLSHLSLTTVQQQLSVYRALQDGRGAIRTIIKRHFEETTSSPFRINVDKIFVGGASAGSLIAMTTSWYTDPMVYQIFPNGAGSATIQQALGPIDADYYYGTKQDLISLQGHDYRANIIGNAAIAAGIFMPPSFTTHEYDFFPSSLLKPLISFQGKQDDVFPYPDDPTKQGINFYPSLLTGSSTYNVEDFCINTTNGNYFLDQDDQTVDLTVGSTLNMRKILLHYGIADEHYVDCDMKHGFSGTPANFHGNFGTSANNPTDASPYTSLNA